MHRLNSKNPIEYPKSTKIHKKSTNAYRDIVKMQKTKFQIHLSQNILKKNKTKQETLENKIVSPHRIRYTQTFDDTKNYLEREMQKLKLKINTK